MEEDVDLDIDDPLTRDVLTAVPAKRKRNVQNRMKVNSNLDLGSRDGGKSGLKTISYDWVSQLVLFSRKCDAGMEKYKLESHSASGHL